MKVGVRLCPALFGFLMPSHSKDASALLAPPASPAPVPHEGTARAFWRVLTRFDSSKLSPYLALRNSVGVLLPLAAGFALNMPRASVVVDSSALNVAYSHGCSSVTKCDCGAPRDGPYHATRRSSLRP